MQLNNLNKWTVKISYAPLTTFDYNFDTLTTARTFASLMAKDSTINVQLIKNV
jgi:hypothetical protein